MADAVDGGQEEVVADECDEDEAVQCDACVHKEGSMQSLLLREDVSRELITRVRRRTARRVCNTLNTAALKHILSSTPNRQLK